MPSLRPNLTKFAKKTEMSAITDDTRVIDLTVGQLVEFLNVQQQPKAEPHKRYEYGIAGIARIFNCSLTTANRIKASGKINDAISQCGRMIAIDVEMALNLLKK